MEPINQKDGGRRQRTREEITRLLEEYKNSEGITVKEYCAMIGVSDAAFYTWRKMYGGSRSAAEEKQAGFIKIVASEPTLQAAGLFAEVRGIKIYQPVSAGFLKSLAL